MDESVRTFFKTERLRLNRNQTEAAVDGITQGMISKIEIDPDYEPSIDVFRRSLAGIGHTLGSFFGQLEGVSAPLHAAADPQLGATDEPPATIAADEIDAAKTVIFTLSRLLADAGEKAARAHRRQTPSPDTPAAGRARRSRKRPHGADQPAPPRRPNKRG